jgi:hypothetical protein
MTETDTTPTAEDAYQAVVGHTAQLLIEEIDNFLKTLNTRHNVPTTEIQDHLLDIRAIAKNN